MSSFDHHSACRHPIGVYLHVIVQRSRPNIQLCDRTIKNVQLEACTSKVNITAGLLTKVKETTKALFTRSNDLVLENHFNRSTTSKIRKTNILIPTDIIIREMPKS